MINKNIINWINGQKQKGVTNVEISRKLLSVGHKDEDVKETLEHLEKPISKIKSKLQEKGFTSEKTKIEREHPIVPTTPPENQAEKEDFKNFFSKKPEIEPTKPTKNLNIEASTTKPLEKNINNIEEFPQSNSKTRLFIIIGVSILILLIVAGVVFWFMTRPVCGNGKMEKGETSLTCCIDVGCHGEQKCENNVCVDPTCGICEYLENHVCEKYTCCSDNDCNDYNDSTIDICINPSTKNSTCQNINIVTIGESFYEAEIEGTEPFYFEYENEKHKIEIVEIKDGEVTFIISSTPQTIKITIGETKEIDLNEDGEIDIEIKLKKIFNNKPIILIKLAPRIMVQFDIEKNTFEQGETMNGNFLINYSGQSKNVLVALLFNKDNYTKEIMGLIQGNLSSIKIINVKPFRMDEDESFINLEKFFEEGKYIYTLNIYDCANIENNLDIICEEINLTNIELNNILTLNPIKTFTKTITVSGGENIIQCVNDSQCNETCEACQSQKQFCSSYHFTCIDCTTTVQCKLGYDCINNSCVKLKCAKKIDCIDGNLSTIDSCVNESCTHIQITTCQHNDCYCPPGCNGLNDNDCGRTCGPTIINCDESTDINCFLNATINCCKAKVTKEFSMDVYGMITDTKAYKEIQGLVGDECKVYEKILNNTISMSAELYQENINAGVSEETIQDYLDVQNENAVTIIGKDGTCNFPIEYLIQKTVDEQNGIYINATRTKERFFCSGTLYD